MILNNRTNNKLRVGVKNIWRKNTNERLAKYLEDVKQIIEPYFQVNGKINMSNFEEKNDLSHLLALIINCEFIADDSKEISSFGADDIIPLQLEIVDHTRLKYWGKISWLTKPKEHLCYRSFQDPFYCELKSNHQELVIEKMMFGNYDKIDLDGLYWIGAEVNWMYEFEI